MRGAWWEMGAHRRSRVPKPLTGGRVERVVDVIGHPRSKAPVVGAVLKGSSARMGPGPVEGRVPGDGGASGVHPNGYGQRELDPVRARLRWVGLGY